MIIVRAGGLTLTAPDVMPEAARGPVTALQLAVLTSDTGHPEAEVGDAAWPHIATVEVVAFGRRHAGRLRRCGKAARLAAHHQLVAGWRKGLFARQAG